MPDLAAAAPAQPAPTDATPAPVLTATETAVAKNDFTAYRETRSAERRGSPAPAPAATPGPDAAPAPAVEEARTVSRRQQQINDYERRIAAQDERIRALESGPTPRTPAPDAAPAAPVAGETFPPYAQYLDAHPDASLEDYIDARQDFRETAKTRASDAQRRDAERSRSQQESIDQAHARTRAARQADPAIEAKFAAWEKPGAVLPDVLFLKTRDQAIQSRQIPVAENDFATAVAHSEFSAQIIAHIADHPELLDRVRALENRTAVNKFVGKLESRFEDADAAPVPVRQKTLSSAPAPGTALGSRPTSAADPVVAAVKSGDVTAYRLARRAERSAGMKS